MTLPLIVLLVVLGAVPASAANVVPGGRYRGSGAAGDVYLQVSLDGSSISHLGFTGPPCFDTADYYGGPEIVNDQFSTGDGELDGTFTTPTDVQGTLHLVNPFTSCDSGTVNWSAHLVHTLRIDHVGAGSGQITVGNDTCYHYGYDDVCQWDYPPGTPISMSVTPDSGSRFDGWSGDCGGTGSCNLTMSADHQVTASFSQLPTHTLTVNVVGGDHGYVFGPIGTGSGIFCGEGDDACNETYVEGTAVTLSAHPDYGWRLKKWSGDCSGTGDCKLTMSQDRSVTATFVALECVVPNVKGKGLRAASNAIFKANCTTGKSTFVHSATVDKNHVISEKPAPGTHLPFRSKVKLVVSLGP